MSIEKITIGRVDHVNFPDFNLNNIQVKIDSGAFTSSIHCTDIKILSNELLSCQFLDPEHPEYHHKLFTFQKYAVKKITSSNGMSEFRYVIETKIELFNQIFPIKLTLTDRGAMTYPVLLGRSFLAKKFIIDTSKTNLSYKFMLKQNN